MFPWASYCHAPLCASMCCIALRHYAAICWGVLCCTTMYWGVLHHHCHTVSPSGVVPTMHHCVLRSLVHCAGGCFCMLCCPQVSCHHALGHVTLPSPYCIPLRCCTAVCCSMLQCHHYATSPSYVRPWLCCHMSCCTLVMHCWPLYGLAWGGPETTKATYLLVWK